MYTWTKRKVPNWNRPSILLFTRWHSAMCRNSNKDKYRDKGFRGNNKTDIKRTDEQKDKEYNYIWDLNPKKGKDFFKSVNLVFSLIYLTQDVARLTQPRLWWLGPQINQRKTLCMFYTTSSSAIVKHHACKTPNVLQHLLFKIPNVVHSRLSQSDFLNWCCYAPAPSKTFQRSIFTYVETFLLNALQHIYFKDIL